MSIFLGCKEKNVHKQVQFFWYVFAQHAGYKPSKDFIDNRTTCVRHGA